MKTGILITAILYSAFFILNSSAEEFRKLYVAEYRDRMAGAWIGQSVGVAYGEPTEFKKSGQLFTDKELPAWKPEHVNRTFHQDDLYVEMTFLRTLETRGVDVGAREAGIDFANSRYRLWCANNNGRNNLRRGIAAPASSHPKYHPSPDDIDYQIEADFSGIIAPGMPARVNRFGETFGRLMNYGDGLYAGQFIGGMYAAAYFEEDRCEVVEAALRQIPSDSAYAAMVVDVLGAYHHDAEDWRGAWTNVVSKWFRPGAGKVTWPAIDAKLNGAMVLLGYLFGEGDMEKTIRISTAGGFDSDCNPSSAAGVLGVQLGAKALGERWGTGAISHTNRWEYTDYTYDALLAVSEKLTRELVVAEGGRILRDEGGEYFLIPEKAPAVGKAVSCLNPGPCADEKYTPEEMEKILYAPTKGMGQWSKPREKKTPEQQKGTK